MIDPDTIEPLGTRLFVQRYELPETVVSGTRDDGSEYEIVTPEAWRRDRSLSVWEVLKVGPEADEAFRAGGGGIKVHDSYEGHVHEAFEVGDIIETAAWTHVPLGNDKNYFVLAESVTVLHKY